MYRIPGAQRSPVENEEWLPAARLDPAHNLRLGSQGSADVARVDAEIDAIFLGVPTVPGRALHLGRCRARQRGEVPGPDRAPPPDRLYSQKPEPTAKTSFGLSLLSPLEGVPRLASSGPGEDRAGGKRRHRGMDLVAQVGEPVRAVADGTVMFAGANIPNSPRDSIPPSRIARYRWRQLGAGGIYVCIEHEPVRHIVPLHAYDTSASRKGDRHGVNHRTRRSHGVHLSLPTCIRAAHRRPATRSDRHFGILVIPPRPRRPSRVMQRSGNGCGWSRGGGARVGSSPPKSCRQGPPQRGRCVRLRLVCTTNQRTRDMLPFARRSRAFPPCELPRAHRITPPVSRARRRLGALVRRSSFCWARHRDRGRREQRPARLTSRRWTRSTNLNSTRRRLPGRALANARKRIGERSRWPRATHQPGHAVDRGGFSDANRPGRVQGGLRFSPTSRPRRLFNPECRRPSTR